MSGIDAYNLLAEMFSGDCGDYEDFENDFESDDDFYEYCHSRYDMIEYLKNYNKVLVETSTPSYWGDSDDIVVNEDLDEYDSDLDVADADWTLEQVHSIYSTDEGGIYFTSSPYHGDYFNLRFTPISE